jgi:hypothetical protein
MASHSTIDDLLSALDTRQGVVGNGEVRAII